MSISIRDEIRPPQAWYDWINSPEREAAMRASGQLGATDGDDTSIRSPDGFSRTVSIRDVGALPSQNASDAYNHFSKLHGDCKDALEGLKVEHKRILAERDEPAKVGDGAGTVAVLDLQSPHTSMLQRWAAKDGLTDDERAARAAAADGGAGEVLDLSDPNARANDRLRAWGLSR